MTNQTKLNGEFWTVWMNRAITTSCGCDPVLLVSIRPSIQRGSLQKLKLVHHRGASYVKNDNSRQSSATAMLQDLGWHSLQHRYANAQLVMSRKCLIDLLHFNFNQYPRLTRQRHSLSLHLNKNYAFNSPLSPKQKLVGIRHC